MHELDASKGQIHLYCKNVFVSDKASDVIPEFLTLLQGAIDCPEIPLNVSRSSLQNDPYVQKISKHIVKKVADKLNQLAKKDSEKFEEIWNDISPFIKYGMMQNDDFYEKVKAQIIFDSSTAKKTRIEDYLSRNEEKIGKKVLYCADKDTQAPYVALCKEQDLEIIYLKGLIDTHFVQFLESKDSEIKYTSIDSELSEILVDEDKASKVVDEENKSSDDKVAELFKSSLDNESLNVEVKSLKSELVSGMLLEDEYMKRMKQMSQFMPGSTPMTGLDNFRLVLNSNHKLIQDIQRLNEAGGKGDLVNELCHHVYDLAKLSKQQLTGDELQAFVSRSNDLMAQLSQEG